jgi:hypothetical protein
MIADRPVENDKNLKKNHSLTYNASNQSTLPKYKP